STLTVSVASMVSSTPNGQPASNPVSTTASAASLAPSATRMSGGPTSSTSASSLGTKASSGATGGLPASSCPRPALQIPQATTPPPNPAKSVSRSGGVITSPSVVLVIVRAGAATVFVARTAASTGLGAARARGLCRGALNADRVDLFDLLANEKLDVAEVERQ